ncbi:MAG: phosphate propanoyltransferase [Oscillospiraceae bacterium]|nr:phosphate propanoyltransferase [Oscillospiraceae bacterium]
MSVKKVEIEGSGKHCHVSRETLDILFGDGFELEIKKMLSQPGQYATPHKITVVGPKRSAEITILGPVRVADQIELSLTDATYLGFDAPIRESGAIEGSPGCKLVGPKGEREIKEGVIIAKRHIHITPEDAEKFSVADKDIVKVKVHGDRSLILDEVVIRVSPDFATYMHVDYDEYNAASISEDNKHGEIVE